MADNLWNFAKLTVEDTVSIAAEQIDMKFEWKSIVPADGNEDSHEGPLSSSFDSVGHVIRCGEVIL